MKNRQNLKREIDWNRYKMKLNYFPIMLLIGAIAYGILAVWFLQPITQLLDSKDTIIFFLGMISVIATLMFFNKFIRYFK